MLGARILNNTEIKANNIKQMTQDKARKQDKEAAAINNDPSLNKEAINELVDEYEKSANDEETELKPQTEKELGNVERALEDSVMGIEDDS